MDVRVRRPGCERLGDRLGGSAADIAVGRVELRHRRLESDRLLCAGEVDAHRAEHLLVETRPRGDARDGLLREDLLLRLGQHVRPEHALRGEPVPPVVERRIGESRRGRPVLDRGPLEPEEEKLRLEARGLLAEPGDEGAAGRVRHVGRELEVREVEGAGGDRLDPLALVDRGGELGGGELGHLPVVALAERGRGRLGLGEVALDARVVA